VPCVWHGLLRGGRPRGAGSLVQIHRRAAGGGGRSAVPNQTGAHPHRNQSPPYSSASCPALPCALLPWPAPTAVASRNRVTLITCGVVWCVAVWIGGSRRRQAFGQSDRRVRRLLRVCGQKHRRRLAQLKRSRSAAAAASSAVKAVASPLHSPSSLARSLAVVVFVQAPLPPLVFLSPFFFSTTVLDCPTHHSLLPCAGQTSGAIVSGKAAGVTVAVAVKGSGGRSVAMFAT
jgi:hypothetical protein